MSRVSAAVWALAVALLLAHLLFLPYASTPLAFDEALRRFAGLSWAALGSDQNVALVSRTLMFAPLGLLLAVALVPRPQSARAVVGGALAAAIGVAWALCVNFAQLWFPARTVLLNLVAAEVVGVAAGALGWGLAGAAWLAWWERTTSGGRGGLRSALGAYVLVYVAVSLTPFDFVTSRAELAEKVAARMVAAWMLSQDCGPAPCSLKFLAVLLASVPVGAWLAGRRARPGLAWGGALAVAGGLAVAIEVLHFFMVSGVSQGASVVARLAGMMAGFALRPLVRRLPAFDARRYARPALLLGFVPWLAVLLYVVGWGRAPFVGVGQGLARLGDVVWMPFLNLYFEGYQSTMRSVIVHVVVYAPVGVFMWLLALGGGRRPPSALLAGVLAALVCAVAETSKLFLAGRLPDYADVIIAALAAGMALAALNRFATGPRERPAAGPAGAPPDRIARPFGDAPRRIDGEAGSIPGARHGASGAAGPGVAAGSSDSVRARAFGRVLGACLVAAAAATAAFYPVAPWALALALASCAVLVWRVPGAWLLILPAALPVFDFAALTGRFFWDEFDALVAVTAGVWLLRRGGSGGGAIGAPPAGAWLLAASVVASAAITSTGLTAGDSAGFFSYLSPLNSVRVLKGYVWGALLAWICVRDAATDPNAPARLCSGLALGLAAAAAGTFWERWTFAGAPGFDDAFRAAGLVSATHVGGAYLEALLVMLAPFALAVVVDARRPAMRALGIVALGLGAAALLMTVSRAAAVAWGIAAFTFAAAFAWKRSSFSRTARGRLAVVAVPVSVAVVAGIAVAGVGTRALAERLSISGSDLSFRVAHWRESLDLLPAGAAGKLLGTGLGSYPREFYVARGAAQRLGSYLVLPASGSDPARLVLAGGQGLYVDQRLESAPNVDATLSGRIRSTSGRATLGVSLCVKSLLNSLGCTQASVQAGPEWRAFEVRVAPVAVVPGGAAPRPPVTLSLSHAEFGARIEVAELSLRAGAGELLRNGGFVRGMDGWFPTSDVHLAWRALNTPVQVAVEQGLLGLLAWAVLLFSIVRGALQPTVPAARAAAALGALSGLAVVALFDTVLDAPRIVMAIALVASAIAARSPARPAA